MTSPRIGVPHLHAAVGEAPFAFVGERMWLDFVNTDDARLGARTDLLRDFGALVNWLVAAGALDAERAASMQRRAEQQPAGASAALADARRVRAALRALAERGARDEGARAHAVAEINRVLGRSTGMRRLEPRGDGTFTRSFVPSGDAFAALIIPVVESAADALVNGELSRVRRCADARCARVFHDGSRNARRRWCEMTGCGNRAKAARHRQRTADRSAKRKRPPAATRALQDARALRQMRG
ncbi:MAG TPA: CGNR zinc finger domain-containing protein [Gemmatimonadaceae bacterium]|nr:CGNR zinc finger domain-containing protein [Gemmatimonadaceae bacterium]